MTRTHLLGAASAVALAIAAPALAAPAAINGGGSTLAQYVYGNGAPNSTPAPNEFTYWNGQATAKAKFGTYWEAGSGTGQLSFLSDNLACDIFKATSSTSNCSSVAAGGTNTAHYGASDAVLSTSQTSSWATSTVGQSAAGNLIQVPTFGTPITVPVQDSNIGSPANGDATLSDADLCAIFSGQISNFSSITDSPGLGSGNFNVVYRSDGSGTSFLLTNHLSAVCNGKGYPITFSATTSFASLFPNSTPPSWFIGESGSSALAGELETLPNAFGYVSPDFTTIAPNSTARINGAPSTLVVASVNGVLPNTTQAALALNHPLTGQNLKPPSNATDAANPLLWVPLIQTVREGYPIVGYTTWDVAQCYSNAAVGAAVAKFLGFNYTNASYLTVQKNNGFVQISKSGASPFLKAITNDLLKNTSGFNTNIQNTGVCKSVGGSTYAGR